MVVRLCGGGAIKVMAAKVADATEKRYKTVILGAGIAGLSVAKHLVKNNMTDFLILEANDRIGGRISSMQIEGFKFEIGANWIHGVLGNPIYEIAMSHGLVDITTQAKPHKIVAATEDGKQVPFAVLQEIYGAYMCFLHRCEEYFLCQYLPPDGISSVGEHIKLEVALYLDRIPDPAQRRIRQMIFHCLLKRETCISGCDSMDEIDLLELGSYTELQGGNILLPTGYSSILTPIYQDIPEHCILLNHKVTEVRWSGKSYDSESGNESDDSGKTVIDLRLEEGIVQEGVEIACENGAKFAADSVVCTLPLGVLKEEASAIFKPKLPDYKMESVERLLFGTVDKIFLGYDRPFLNQDITEVLFLWTENCDNSGKNEDLKDTWFKKIYSFSKVSDTLLLGWVSGKEALFMESLPDEQIAETCTGILRKFLNDPFVPKPKFIYCTRWHSDNNTRGSYTALAVGSSQVDIECVAQPIFAGKKSNQPVLMFAGEHTHNNFYSTAHGAYLSGRTTAQLILDAQAPTQVVLDSEGTADLSSWIRSISLE